MVISLVAAHGEPDEHIFCQTFLLGIVFMSTFVLCLSKERILNMIDFVSVDGGILRALVTS